MERRSFIELLGAGTLFAHLDGNHSGDGPKGKDFWTKVAREFPARKSEVLNLNNGSAGSMPALIRRKPLGFYKRNE